VTLAEADAHLGRPVPLPRAPLPLTRWVEVHAVADGAVEVEWNLDDSRAGTPARLALYAGRAAPPDRGWGPGTGPFAHRTVPLAEAEPSLRPAHELRWRTADGLHLRLTAQGPWDHAALVRIAESVS